MAPFTRQDLILAVQREHPDRPDQSPGSVIQGMTKNATGGPRQPCGTPLIRIDRGLYALDDSSAAADGQVVARATPSLSVEHSADPGEPWHWEGNVQSVIARFLADEGWSIQRVADTAARQQGVDVVAAKGERTLRFEVKGYPTETYARGERKGEQKRTRPMTQARHRYAGALLSLALLHEKHSEGELGLALPLFPTYTSLVKRTRLTLAALGVSVYFVQEDGGVIVVPHGGGGA